MISDIAIIVLAIALIANAYALFRHWQALQAFRIALNNMVETQRLFNELVDTEKRKQS
jgi:hypothetical protein